MKLLLCTLTYFIFSTSYASHIQGKSYQTAKADEFGNILIKSKKTKYPLRSIGLVFKWSSTRCHLEGFETGFLADLKKYEASLPTLTKKGSINLYAKPILASGWEGKVISDSRKILQSKNNSSQCKQVLTLKLKGPFTHLICEQSDACNNMFKVDDFVEFLEAVGFHIK